MKNTLLLTLSSIWVCSLSFASELPSITLTAQPSSGYFVGDASLSLWTLKHADMPDYEATSVYYESQPGAPEYEAFRMNTTVSDVGHIVDLGKIACKDVPNSYEGKPGYPPREDRQRDPMRWLVYTDAYDALNGKNSSGYARVQGDHCYILHKVTRRGRVVALLHAKSYVPGKSVELDEIEVFDRSEFKRN